MSYMIVKGISGNPFRGGASFSVFRRWVLGHAPSAGKGQGRGGDHSASDRSAPNLPADGRGEQGMPGAIELYRLTQAMRVALEWIYRLAVNEALAVVVPAVGAGDGAVEGSYRA